MAQKDIQSWMIGDVRVSRIVEVGQYPVDIGMLLPGRGPGDVQALGWLHPLWASPEGQIFMSWQAFLVETPTLRIMIDTCIGRHDNLYFAEFNNLQTSFFEDLASLGCTPETVDIVLCTHLHYDHVGWNTRLVDGKRVPSFPNARYIFGREEWDDMNHLRQTGDWHARHLPDSVDPIVEAGLAEFVETTFRLCDEIALEPTPGHTPGHASVVITSKGQTAVITGDMMHHPIQCALPDDHGAFDADPATGCATRRDFLCRHGDGETLIIGSHFPHPTVGTASADPDSGAWIFQTSGA